MEKIIRTENLTKFFGRIRGIEAVNLEVYQGEVFGFLGPNGSGKTTTLRLLLGLIRPTRGRIWMFGETSRSSSTRLRARVGYLPGELRLFEEMTGGEFLSFLGSLNGGADKARLRRLMDLLRVSRAETRRRIRGYSSGMRQKMGLIQAFQHDPDLLCLDEPTRGLDPLARNAFEELLQECKHRRRTVFLSSHLLSEVQRLCNRAAVVRSGRLVAVESLENLKQRQVRRMTVVFDEPVDPADFVGFGYPAATLGPDSISLEVKGEIGPLLQVLSRYAVRDIVYPEADLRDLFVSYFGG